MSDIAQRIERTCPIATERNAKPHPMRIPWSVAELAYSAYAGKYGRIQTLERLAERGGFYPSEMDQLLPDWRERSDELERLRLEVDGQRNRADALTHHCTGLEAELERLRAVVERLPKTADGVPVTPGDDVWLTEPSPHCVAVIRVESGGVIDTQFHYHDYRKVYGSNCHSTREDAEAAKEAKP